MKKRLIVHMGIHRTGSTALQETLKKNRTILLEHGFLYPRLFGEDAHTGLPGQLKKRQLTGSALMAEIKKEERENTHTIILSAEDFCTLKRFVFLHALQQTYRVDVILYLRRQTEWLESWYNQHIKWPWERRFSAVSAEQFLKKSWRFHWMDYCKLLRRILRVVPYENICVNTLEAHGVTDSKEDFFTFAGIDSQWLETADETNASLSSMQIGILRYLDLMNRDGRERWKIIAALKQMQIDEDNGAKIVFTDAQAEKISRRFSRSNSRVAQQFFGRSELFMDDEIRGRVPKFPEEKIVRERYIPLLLQKAGLA